MNVNRNVEYDAIDVIRKSHNTKWLPLVHANGNCVDAKAQSQSKRTKTALYHLMYAANDFVQFCHAFVHYHLLIDPLEIDHRSVQMEQITDNLR